MKAAIYCRVSTWDQNTLPIQLKDCRDYVSSRGWELVHTESETASGVKRRPSRDVILKLARQRKIDVVVVWKLDRWGRSVSDVTSTLEELTTLGVAFVSINEALDFTTTIGKAMSGLLAVFAELERDFLRERVKAGLEEARRNGKLLGRPGIPENKKLKIHALWKKNKSKAEIERVTGVSRRSISRILNTLQNSALAYD
jgi:DNA invertase Pin-like site-specific DNA recombinase